MGKAYPVFQIDEVFPSQSQQQCSDAGNDPTENCRTGKSTYGRLDNARNCGIQSKRRYNTASNRQSRDGNQQSDNPSLHVKLCKPNRYALDKKADEHQA